jgi:hypothetical protein
MVSEANLDAGVKAVHDHSHRDSKISTLVLITTWFRVSHRPSYTYPLQERTFDLVGIIGDRHNAKALCWAINGCADCNTVA